MLIRFAASAAWSIDVSTPPCAGAEVEQTAPRDGEVVGPDVRPLVFHDSGCTGAFQLRLARVDADQPYVELGSVAVDGAPLTSFLLQVTPSEPLVDGASYVLDVEGLRVQFQIGEARPAPLVPAVSTAFAHTCDQATLLEVAVDATFGEVDRASRGLLSLVTSVDGVSQGIVDAVAYAGQPEETLSDAVLGGRQLCASLRLDDDAGVTVWQTEEVCGEPVDCPAQADGSSPGCGCASIRPGLGWLAAGFAALVGRRRRTTARPTA